MLKTYIFALAFMISFVQIVPLALALHAAIRCIVTAFTDWLNFVDSLGGLGFRMAHLVLFLWQVESPLPLLVQRAFLQRHGDTR